MRARVSVCFLASMTRGADLERLLVDGRGASEAPEDRLDAREQLGDGERLGHVVVGAGVEPADLVRLLPARGQDDDRHQRVEGADLLAHR